MRTLLLAAGLAVLPAVSAAQVLSPSLVQPEPVAELREVPHEAERANIVSGVLGGEGLSVGLGYERRITGPVFARTGVQYFSNGVDVRAAFVPLSAGGVKKLGGRWAVDGSLGAMVAFLHNDGEAFPRLGIEATPTDYVRVRATLGLGVRYETDRLFLRGGAAIFPVHIPDRLLDDEDTSRWIAFPWPSLSAGIRF